MFVHAQTIQLSNQFIYKIHYDVCNRQYSTLLYLTILNNTFLIPFYVSRYLFKKILNVSTIKIINMYYQCYQTCLLLFIRYLILRGLKL